MAKCSICGKQIYLPFKCKFCGDSFCEEHRLPENHWCIGLKSYERDLRERRILMPEPSLQPKNRFFHLFNIFSQNYSYILLLLISISFILQLIPGYEELLILTPSLVLQRPWTLITHIFLHANFTHFFFNILFLIFFAPVLERKIGSAKFLFIFFASGVIAGIGHCLTSSNPVVGASGALYGVFGALAMIEPHMTVYVYFIPMKIGVAVLLFALMDFLLIGSGDMIAHAAHLSGLLVGLIVGYNLKS
ncbi:MAG: rhomboid family intramembrane serine protease [Methanocellales archaeon]